MTAKCRKIRNCLSCGATLPDDGTSRKRCEDPCAVEWRLEQARQWKKNHPAETAAHMRAHRERNDNRSWKRK